MSNTTFYHTKPRWQRKTRWTPPPPRPPKIYPPEHSTADYMRLYNKFFAYHNANQRIYQLIDEYTHKAIDADQKHWGIAAIFEVMRWDYTIRTYDPTLNFKFPNNHRSFYSRLWEYNNRDYIGFFRKQRHRSGKKGKIDEYGRDE